MPGSPGNIGKYQASLTPEQRKENSRRASTQKRPGAKRGADIRKIAKAINNAPAGEGLKEALEALNVSDPTLKNAAGIAVSVYQSALSGDMKAVEKWERYVGQSDKDVAPQELSQEAALTRPYHLPAELVVSHFSDTWRDILRHDHREYLLKGGRGSTKSAFIAEAIIALIMSNPEMNAVVVRKVGNTLRSSVYNTVVWALDVMGLAEEFTCKVSPMEIVRRSTGQTIYFFGLDDPLKLKSFKTRMGYNGIVWFEEMDQFAGPAEIRSVKQSVLRGGDQGYTFLSFNPPKTRNNWANIEAEQIKESRLTSHTTYETVPKEWLGEDFLRDAEELKLSDPEAYEHEYLGVPNGAGGMVFQNVVAEEITDEQIQRFDRIYRGVDWGYYPDPWAFTIMHYDAARRTLYIFGELRGVRLSNEQTANMIKAFGVKPDELITADSAEPKSIGDYRAFGLFCMAAKKGPGSVEYSMKRLASLKKIVIDPNRCPYTYQEFVNYEYERTPEGQILTGYPDANNHQIDSVRYAMEAEFKWMGQ